MGKFKEQFVISKEELEKLAMDGFTQKEIAEIYGCSLWVISNRAIRYKIGNKFKKGKHEEIKLTEEQRSVLNGTMLGDGHITGPLFGNSQLSYSSSVENHVKYIGAFFKDYLTNECLSIKKEVEPKYRLIFDKRTNKHYNNYRIRTQNNITFTHFRDIWYKERIKCIPNNLILDPLMCLVWYIGDGHLHKRHHSVFLSTQGFNKQDIVEILLPQLSIFKARIIKKEKQKEQYAITIPRKMVPKFLEFIGPCPIEDMKYKWNYVGYKNKKYEHGEVKSYIKLVPLFVEMYKQGLSPYKISQKFQLDPSGIRHHLIKEGVYKNPEEKFIKDELLFHVKNNLSVVEIAKIYGVSEPTIYSRFRKFWGTSNIKEIIEIIERQ